MNTVQDQTFGITRDTTCKYAVPGGNFSEALAPFDRRDAMVWKLAIDAMLAWKLPSCTFEVEDQPNVAVLDTAIDYAVDQIRDGGPAPESIMPSGSGRIAMEWNEGTVTVVVEFVGLGIATYTRFDGRVMVARNTLRRNPTSRKLELRG